MYIKPLSVHWTVPALGPRCKFVGLTNTLGLNNLFYSGVTKKVRALSLTLLFMGSHFPFLCQHLRDKKVIGTQYLIEDLLEFSPEFHSLMRQKKTVWHVGLDLGSILCC